MLVERRPAALLIVAASGVALFGVLGILGWIGRLSILASGGPSFIPMAPSTAIGFTLLGAAALLDGRGTRSTWTLGAAALTFVAVLAQLVTSIVGMPPWLDLLLVPAPIRFGLSLSGEMSPLTAIGFLLGCGGILLSAWGFRARFASGIVATITSFIGMAVVVSYAFGAPFLYERQIVPTAITTGAAFAFFGLVTAAFAGNESFPLMWLVGPSSRARLLRVLLPMAPVVLLADGIFSQTVKFHNQAFDALFDVLVLLLVMTVTTILISRSMGAAVDASLAATERNARQLAAVFEGSIDAMIILEEGGRVVEANPAARALFSLSDDDLRRHVLAEFVPAETQLEKLWARFLTEGRLAGEFPFKRLDGTQFTVEIAATANILPGRHLAILKDVTGRRRNEKETQRLASIVESTSDAVYVKSLDGTVLSWNKGAENLFGYTAAEIIGQSARLLLPDDDRESLAEVIAKIRAGGVVEHYESQRVRKDGEGVIVSLTESPIRDPSGTVIAISAIARDVTDQRRAERALAESEAKLRAFFESDAVGIMFGDVQGNVLDANAALLRMLGYSREDLSSRRLRWVDITPHEYQSIDDAGIAEARARGTCTPYEKQFIRKDGGRISVIVGYVLLEPERERSVAFLVDISDRKLLESQLLQAQKMEAVGRLAGGIAHDFNNMLGVILSYSEFLLRQLPEPHRSRIEQIMIATKRASDLTGQLLAFSRKQILEPRIINLGEFVSDMESMLARVIGEDINLATIRGETGLIRADQSRLQQVLLNLCVNAKDAMPQGGAIRIETANADLDSSYSDHHDEVIPGPYVMMAVSDTGIGMDAETKSHMFEPFFTTKEIGKGTGLGLSTVYGIVRQSGGNIWVYSELGRGSTFKVYFPRVESAVEASPEAPPAELLRGTETILLVEDSESLRLVTKEMLEQNGYTVIEAANGLDALAVARQTTSPIDLLVTDVVMPGMNGRVLAEKLSAMVSSVPVLFVSGYTDDVIFQNGLLEPHNLFLSKPFTSEALLRRVRDALGDAAATS